jgi:hypothetical protein
VGNSWAPARARRVIRPLTWENCAPSGTRTPNPVDESHGERGDVWCFVCAGQQRCCCSSIIDGGLSAAFVLWHKRPPKRTVIVLRQVRERSERAAVPGMVGRRVMRRRWSRISALVAMSRSCSWAKSRSTAWPAVLVACCGSDEGRQCGCGGHAWRMARFTAASARPRRERSPPGSVRIGDNVAEAWSKSVVRGP